jgi:hypothetical protein
MRKPAERGRDSEEYLHVLAHTRKDAPTLSHNADQQPQPFQVPGLPSPNPHTAYEEADEDWHRIHHELEHLLEKSESMLRFIRQHAAFYLTTSWHAAFYFVH